MVDIIILVVLFHHTYSDKTHYCRSFKIDVSMSIRRLKTNPWMIMSKYNSSLVQVVTPPQYYDWCAAVWLQGPESLPPVSVSRHCRQSAGSPVPPTAGSCSCLQPGCSGLQGTAATCSTVHTLDSSSASRGTDTQQLLSIITPYHGPCFQDLTSVHICLRSRPVTPDVVRQLVSQLVSQLVR